VEISHARQPERGPLGQLLQDRAESESRFIGRQKEVIAGGVGGKGRMDPAMHGRAIGYTMY